jgi:hypothetical protein
MVVSGMLDRAAPWHQVMTTKIRIVGTEFGRAPLLESTVGELVAAARS